MYNLNTLHYMILVYQIIVCSLNIRYTIIHTAICIHVLYIWPYMTQCYVCYLYYLWGKSKTCNTHLENFPQLLSHFVNYLSHCMKIFNTSGRIKTWNLLLRSKTFRTTIFYIMYCLDESNQTTYTHTRTELHTYKNISQ